MPISKFQKGLQHHRMSWLIPDMIPTENLTIISGEPNVGKSRLWTQFAWMMSRGETLFWPKVDPFPVLYCSERGTSEVIEQMHLLGINYLEGNPNFHLMTIGDMTRAEAAAFNADPLKVLHEISQALMPKMIILDTMGQFLIHDNGSRNVSNVNDYGSSVLRMRTFRQWCHWNTVSLLGVHHMRKQSMNDSSLRTQDRSLGSQAIVGGTGQAWTIENLTGDTKADVRYIRIGLSIHCRAWREPIYLKAGIDSPFEVCTEQEALESNLDPAEKLITAPLQEKVLEALPKSGSTVTKSNLADAISKSVGCEPVNVYKAIKKLVEKGKIKELRDPDTGLQLIKVVVAQ